MQGLETRHALSLAAGLGAQKIEIPEAQDEAGGFYLVSRGGQNRVDLPMCADGRAE